MSTKISKNREMLVFTLLSLLYYVCYLILKHNIILYYIND